MYCTKLSVNKIEKRGHTNGICFIGGDEISIDSVGRSIHHRIGIGSGEVRNIGIVYCPTCDEKPILPKHGTPITEDELCQVACG